MPVHSEEEDEEENEEKTTQRKRQVRIRNDKSRQEEGKEK